MMRRAVRLKGVGVHVPLSEPRSIVWLGVLGLCGFATACHPPPKPDAMTGFESLRQASDGDTLRERAAALTAEADAHQLRARRAYEEDQDVELAGHEATLALLAWRAATARSQHMDHEASARAARARLANAEANLASATRRREAAQDALDRTRRLVATQHRLMEAEQQARMARRAGRAKDVLDQVALTLVQAEAAGASKYAPIPLRLAEDALAEALDAYEIQDYKTAETRGNSASQAASQALEIARPLSHAARVYQAQATQLLTLVAESARLAGGTAVLDARGVVLRLHDLFEPRGSVLKPSAQEAVRQMVAFAGAQPDLRLLVEGHADGAGKAESKAARAAEQAHVLGRALLSAGLAAERIRVLGMGATAPIADSGTLAGRRSNRRLEVVFLQPEATWPPSAAEVALDAPAARSAGRTAANGLNGTSSEVAEQISNGAMAQTAPSEATLGAIQPAQGPETPTEAFAAPLKATDLRFVPPAQPLSAPTEPLDPTPRTPLVSAPASAVSPTAVPASAASPDSGPTPAISPDAMPAAVSGSQAP